MRAHRHRLAALLLAGVLGALLGGCGQPAIEVREDRSRAEHRLRPLAPDVAASLERADRSEDGFRFPDDKGGQMLARALPPSGPVEKSRSDMSSGPRPAPGSPALEEPSPLLPAYSGPMPRLPANRNGSSRPRSLPDSLPLFGARPELPAAAQFAVGDRINQRGPDANRPVPLPLLAQPAPEQGLLDDPTADYSSSAAQSAATLGRDTPAPFVRASLPDPFENRNAAKMRQVPAEHMAPVTASPKLPGK